MVYEFLETGLKMSEAYLEQYEPKITKKQKKSVETSIIFKPLFVVEFVTAAPVFKVL